MNCEIEFLPVGEASKAGDAIIVRYGTEASYSLMLIDAGFDGTGPEIVAHISKHFPGKRISHALLTHSDRDHAGGFRTVLDELVVDYLWLNQPWEVDAASLTYFADKRWTVDGLRNKIRAEYDLLGDLVDIAARKGIIVKAPFAGATIGPFEVLTPTRDVYRMLVPQFDRTPDADEDALKAAGLWIGKQSFLSKLVQKATAAAQKFFEESWSGERLKDGAVTTPSNESSVVLYGFDNVGPVLMTGDAGVRALTMAADRAVACGLSLQQFSAVQVPHHGSRSNVGPTILNRLLGPIVPQGASHRFSALVSAPKDDSSHPRQMVVNAFIRRGGLVVATQGSKQLHRGGFAMRAGYVDATTLPFVEKVEDYD